MYSYPCLPCEGKQNTNYLYLIKSVRLDLYIFIFIAIDSTDVRLVTLTRITIYIAFETDHGMLVFGTFLDILIILCCDLLFDRAEPHYGWADVVGDSTQLLSIQPRGRPPGVFPTLDFGSSRQETQGSDVPPDTPADTQ